MHRRAWLFALPALCACSLLRGGEGEAAPGPADSPQLACADLTQQAPAFFRLLDDPAKPLDALRATVSDLAQVQCFDAERLTCVNDSQCHGLGCDGGICDCLLPYNALGEVLRAALRGLAAASAEPPESAAQRCVSIAQAAALAQPNHLCELKRAWSVIAAGNGMRALLADPRLALALQQVTAYASGQIDGAVHDGVAGTLGRMARRNDLCDPADMGTLAEKLLANLTPALAAEVSAKLTALVEDPTLRPLLLRLASGGNPQGRASVIYLAHFLISEISAVSTGAEASADLQQLLDDAVFPLTNAGLRQHIQDAADLLKRALADDVGAFPSLQRVVGCAANPAVDADPVSGVTGEFIGSFYDLLVLPNGIDVPATLSLLSEAVALDQDGQVVRALHGVVAAIRSDEQALDASRAAFAEALCGPAAGGAGFAGDGRSPQGGALETCTGEAFARGMLPALSLLVQSGALGDLITLLSDVLDGCGQ